MNRSGGPCLFSIADIKCESCSENGDVLGFVLDTALKKVILRSGETRSILHVNLIDRSSPSSPIVHQIWGDSIRKYHSIVGRGAFLFITNFTRLKSREGEIVIRGGDISVFFGKNLQKMLQSQQYNHLFTVEQQALTELITWAKATALGPLVRYY